jgi:hypothetical protein
MNLFDEFVFFSRFHDACSYRFVLLWVKNAVQCSSCSLYIVFTVKLSSPVTTGLCVRQLAKCYKNLSRYMICLC